MSHRFHPTSLREYDIRGIYGQTLGETDARALGRSFGTLVVRSGGTRRRSRAMAATARRRSRKRWCAA